MTDREFAIKIRRILLSAISLIEEYYKLGKYSEAVTQEVRDEDTITMI